MAKPSVGRIVHYQTSEGCLPAIIVEVMVGGEVSLWIFGYFQMQWMSEVCFEDNEGSPIGSWHWPERED